MELNFSTSDFAFTYLFIRGKLAILSCKRVRTLFKNKNNKWVSFSLLSKLSKKKKNSPTDSATAQIGPFSAVQRFSGVQSPRMYGGM